MGSVAMLVDTSGRRGEHGGRDYVGGTATAASAMARRGREREAGGGMRCRGGRAGDVGVVRILQRRGRQAGDAVARAAASRCPSSAYWQR